MSGNGSDRYYGSARWPEFDPEQATREDPARDPLSPATTTYGRGGKSVRSRPAKPPRSARTGGRRWARIAVLTVFALILVFVGTAIGTWLWASSKVTKVAALSDYDGRPAQGAGTNWLVVGSDSRSNLTPAQKSQLHVGSDQGQRTDTIMLLHYGSGAPDLISIPRDSYVPIPAYTDSSGKTHAASKNKINAAYDLGGAALLVKTVEMATGVRIDHYLEVGFLGVVDVVDSVGGVHLCLDAPVKDSHSGADLPAGCQNLDGTQSLALIRTRYSLANSDISRMANQQKFVAALAKSVLRPGVEFNPFAFYPFLDSALGSVAVDDGSGLYDLVTMARKVRPITDGKGMVGTVPIGNEGYQVPGVGSSVLWNSAKAKQLFGAVNQDSAIPGGLLNTIG